MLLPTEFRAWLADVLDVNSTYEYRLKTSRSGSAEDDLDSLIAALRSKAPLPSEIRSRLASLSSESGTKLMRRGRGQPRAAIDRHWEAAEAFDQLCCDPALNRKQALGIVEKKFGISRATLEAEIQSYHEALLISQRVLREG